MRRMNWSVICSNFREAREELERLERLVANPRERSEIKLAIGLAHAHHHLNFAWHSRRVSTARYRDLSDADFHRWGAFPEDIELPSAQ